MIEVGDLVKHPAGIKNVCEETYRMGIVLQVNCLQRLQNHAMGAQVKVLWHGKQNYLVYHSTQLEVISASR